TVMDVESDLTDGTDGDAVSDTTDLSDTTDTTDIDALARQVCSCLLINCHDPFHEKYGETDGEAVPACQAEVAALPLAGMDVSSGNFIECRQLACADANRDCDAALGAAPCQ